jgi:hypothetical protein
MFSGVPVIYGIDPFNTETTPSHQLGSLGITNDGRKFRYALNGASTLVPGDLLQGRVEDTGDQSLLVAAGSIGDFSITTVGTVTVTANQYANGYVICTGEGGTGNGQIYKIKSHPAATAAVVTLTLWEPLKVAITTSTQIDLVPNLYDGVVQYLASPSSAPAGIAFVAATSGVYTWIQTGGVGLCLADGGGAIAVGQGVVASNATAGAVEDVASTTQPVIGTALTGIAQAETGAVFLTLD